MWGLDTSTARHRRPEPATVVHLVFRNRSEVVLPADSALARSMGQVAALLTLRI